MSELARSDVTLRFFGDDLIPEELTQMLGCTPTVGVRKDGTWLTLRGAEKTARTGSWRLNAPRSLPGDLNGQISSLFAQLTTDLAVWEDLARRYRADLFCGLFLRDGNEGMILSVDTLTAISQRRLFVDFDIYYYGPDSEEWL
jgi:hypothetical protein